MRRSAPAEPRPTTPPPPRRRRLQRRFSAGPRRPSNPHRAHLMPPSLPSRSNGMDSMTIPGRNTWIEKPEAVKVGGWCTRWVRRWVSCVGWVVPPPCRTAVIPRPDSVVHGLLRGAWSADQQSVGWQRSGSEAAAKQSVVAVQVPRHASDPPPPPPPPACLPACLQDFATLQSMLDEIQNNIALRQVRCQGSRQAHSRLACCVYTLCTARRLPAEGEPGRPVALPTPPISLTPIPPPPPPPPPPRSFCQDTISLLTGEVSRLRGQMGGLEGSGLSMGRWAGCSTAQHSATQRLIEARSLAAAGVARGAGRPACASRALQGGMQAAAAQPPSGRTPHHRVLGRHRRLPSPLPPPCGACSNGSAYAAAPSSLTLGAGSPADQASAMAANLLAARAESVTPAVQVRGASWWRRGP